MAETVLTSAQVQVLHLFFRLPESEGFYLAGGAGLVAVGLSERPTEDVDLFAPDASIRTAGDALEVAATASGWSVERLRDADTFCRLGVRVAAGEETMVDLAQMLHRLDRYSDEQIAGYGVEPSALRARFRRWAADLAETT